MIKHKVVTVTTTATSILALTGLPGGIFRQLEIQLTPASTAVVFIGGSSSTLTTADYGVLLPIPVSNVPAAPYLIEADIGIASLAEVMVMATNTASSIAIKVIYP